MSAHQTDRSITPPVSPVGESEFSCDYNIVNKIADQDQFSGYTDISVPSNSSFQCLGCVTPDTNDKIKLHKNSYMKSGDFYRVISMTVHPDFYSNYHSSSSMSICGFNFILCDSFSDAILERIFYLFRQKLSLRLVSSSVMSTGYFNSNVNSRVAPDDLKSFPGVLKLICYRYLASGANTTKLVGNLMALVKHMGCFATISVHNLSNCHKDEMFHLLLDLRWTILSAFLSLEKTELILQDQPFSIETQNYDLHSSIFRANPISVKYTYHLIQDLTGAAFKIFEKGCVYDYWQTSPFFCTCIRELWTMLIHFADALAENKPRGFWSIISSVFEEMLNVKNLAPGKKGLNFTSDLQPGMFCWWILTNVCDLYKINKWGDFKPDEFVSSGTGPEIKQILRCILSNRDLNEASMRFVLIGCLRMSAVDACQGDSLIMLWEYFAKRLDAGFLLQGQLTGIANIPNTAVGWYAEVKKREDLDTFKDENSYSLFLVLAARLLNCNLQEWAKLKGRVLLKFPTKKICELSEAGLFNSLDLFLTIALAIDQTEMTKKFCEILSALEHEDPSKSRTGPKILCCWKAMFTLLHIHAAHNSDMALVATELRKSFIYWLDSNPNFEQSAQNKDKLFCCYIEGIQGLFSNSRCLELSRHLLFDVSLSRITLCRPLCEQSLALVAFQEIVAKIGTCVSTSLSIATDKSNTYSALVTAVWGFLFPVIKHFSSSTNRIKEVSALTNQMTELLLTFCASQQFGHGSKLLELVNAVAFSAEANEQLVSSHLLTILQNLNLRTFLGAKEENTEKRLVRSWVNSCVRCSHSDFQFERLTRVVLNLPLVRQIMETSSLHPGDSCNSVRYLISAFFVAYGQNFNNIQTFGDKLIYRDQLIFFLGDLSKIIGSIMKSEFNQDRLSDLYFVVGTIVKECSNMLYIKSRSDCMLPMFLSLMVLPRPYYQTDKPIPQVVLHALEQHLPSFVTGLISCGFRRDPYIARALKDIIVIYTPHFATSIHPLLASVNCGLSDNNDELAVFVLEVIRDNYVTKWTSTSTLKRAVCRFLTEFISTTGHQTLRFVISILLEPILSSLLDDPDKYYTDVLKELLSSSKLNEQMYLSVLKDALKEFIRQKLPNSSQKLYKLLEVVYFLHHDLMTKLIPDLSEILYQYEEHRGVGQDNTIRQGYQRLLACMGAIPSSQL